MEHDEARSRFKGKCLLVEMVQNKDWKALDSAIEYALPRMGTWSPSKKRSATSLENDDDYTPEPDATPVTTLPAPEDKQIKKRRRFTEAESEIIKTNWQKKTMEEIAKMCNGMFYF